MMLAVKNMRKNLHTSVFGGMYHKSLVEFVSSPLGGFEIIAAGTQAFVYLTNYQRF